VCGERGAAHVYQLDEHVHAAIARGPHEHLGRMIPARGHEPV
jgi:hypothetical protein